MTISTALLMFISHRSAEARIMDVVMEAGHDISPAQGRLLARIDEHGTRIGDLADYAQITRQTATALVDRLEKSGFVHRAPDPADGRSRLVILSEYTREKILPLAREKERVIEQEWVAHLGKKRMDQLRATLEDLRKITDPSFPG
ncbi:MarR family winged helix-turn-helix transcriptional regulator [Corynebacterium lubricantis]|uniref:MarR family winged helix-turn-helix transcriptional regulator n=1 Tax=Corynebacterium lubricantis TaxID=541095 RepID=UPI000366102D|nr:MarR family transcriptional regulator [Corynebacterium lubricantis]